MKERADYKKFIERLKKSEDETRIKSTDKRHSKGYRTARENLLDLVDEGSFLEFGQFAVAAQRSRRNIDDLLIETNADGVITGFCSINKDISDKFKADAIAIVYDYSVLAGTQGLFHHQKLDRIIDKAKKYKLPIVIYTEGGGGRPGDVDVLTQIAGMHIPTFANWAALDGVCIRIAISNGYCFAGNAALFGASDIRIATKNANIGMAGPAMIEGGGLGNYSPDEIGKIDDHISSGVVDLIADDEKHATYLAKKILGYFQGFIPDYEKQDQQLLKNILPEDRRYSYEVRDIIKLVSDVDSFIELKVDYGKSLITGFIRIEGKPLGLVASDCKFLGGAVDSESAEKAADFYELCNSHNLPMLALVDSPGFMVGPASEKEVAVRRMSKLFKASATFQNSLVAVFLRKGYGLGAQAIVGGSLHKPTYTCAWPSGEFGGMGIEGAVKLGFKKELEAIEDKDEREELYNKLVNKMYDAGQAIEAASFLEIDAVIDPADTRSTILNALR